jgi:hypothetical protein
MRKSIVVSFIAAFIMGLVTVAVASAETWEPKEREVALHTTTAFSLEVPKKEGGTGVFSCEFMAAGKTGNHMEIITFTPVLFGCSGAVSAEVPKGSAWKAQSLNATQASLSMPEGAIKLIPKEGCVITVQASVIGEANDIVAGTVAKWTPGKAGTLVKIKDEPAECYNKATEVVFKLSTEIVAAEGAEVKS